LSLIPTSLRLPLVEAQVGGQTLRCLVDTGFTTCAISSGAAERAGIEPLGEGSLTLAGSTGQLSAARVGIAREFSLRAREGAAPSALVVRDVLVAILTPEMLGEIGEIDCVLGWEVLQRLVIEIAGSSGELVLRRSTPRDVERNLVWLREPLVRVRSGDVPLYFQLDTGDNATEVTPLLVEKLGLRDLETRENFQIGIGRRVDGENSYVPDLALEIGGSELRLGNLAVLEDPRDPAHDFVAQDGVLGADLGLAARLVIDAPNRRVDFVAR
jgi:predicted aspartyl protease